MVTKIIAQGLSAALVILLAVEGLSVFAARRQAANEEENERKEFADRKQQARTGEQAHSSDPNDKFDTEEGSRPPVKSTENDPNVSPGNPGSAAV